MENVLLRDYDNAWNKRRNAGDDGIRLGILPSDPEDSDDSDDYDGDNAEETCILNKKNVRKASVE